MMKTRKLRKMKLNAALAALTLFVVVASSTVTGLTVAKATKINMTLTDDVVVSIYLLTMLGLSQLVSWLLPRPRRTR